MKSVLFPIPSFINGFKMNDPSLISAFLKSKYKYYPYKCCMFKGKIYNLLYWGKAKIYSTEKDKIELG